MATLHKLGTIYARDIALIATPIGGAGVPGGERRYRKDQIWA